MLAARRALLPRQPNATAAVLVGMISCCYECNCWACVNVSRHSAYEASLSWRARRHGLQVVERMVVFVFEEFSDHQSWEARRAKYASYREDGMLVVELKLLTVVVVVVVAKEFSAQSAMSSRFF